MDTRTALDILKNWPVEETAALTPEQETALRLLEEDPALDLAFRQLDLLDERISWSMSDVAVDDDAQVRLLKLLQSAEVPAVELAPQSASDVTRRSVLRRAIGLTTASTLMLVVSGWLIWNEREIPLSTADIRSAVPALWTGALPAFDESFSVALPEGGWQSSRVRFDEAIGGLSVRPAGTHQMAVREFTLPAFRQRSTRGLLLIMPANTFAVADRPREGDFLSGGAPKYVTVEDGTQLAIVGWTEGDFVYFCVLPAGPPEEMLKQSLHITVS